MSGVLSNYLHYRIAFRKQLRLGFFPAMKHLLHSPGIKTWGGIFRKNRVLAFSRPLAFHNSRNDWLSTNNRHQYNGHRKDHQEHPVFGSAALGVPSGVLLFWQWDRLRSESSPIHSLKPVETAETYEMGLYQASIQEEEEYARAQRLERKGLGPWYARLYFHLKFALEDYVVDPCITFVRFLELAAIIFPLIFVSPICWLGKKDRDIKDGSRYGAKLWFRYLRWSAELAGPSFIKLAQWAASRTDIFPHELCEELSHLHSNAKAHSFHQTKKILSASFGMPFEDIFDEFDKKPVGVGAIAQVHLAKLSEKAIQKAKEEKDLHVQLSLKLAAPEHVQFWQNVIVTQLATLFSSKQKVAIKVLHPHVEVKVNRDLAIMRFFANMIDLIPSMEWLSLPQEVEQFSILMRLQLDLRIESLNLAKFRHNFRDRLDIHFPKPYLNFSSKQVLVEEYIKAIPMSRMLSLKDNFGKNVLKEISDKGLDAFLQMLLLDNFVHADLHPGNMLVRFYKNELFKHEKEYKIVKSSNEQETNRITEELLALGDDDQAWYEKLEHLYEHGYHAEVCFLDVGLVTELNQTDRVNFIDLFKALSEFDGYTAGELMVERSRTPETVINKEIFALKVEKLVDRMKQRTFTLGSVSIGDLLDQVLGMVRTHHVRMEGDFITVIVAILLLEGIGRQLDPELDLFARFVYAIMWGFPTEQMVGFSIT